MLRSRAAFGSFTFTGVPAVDNAILDKVKDEAHRGVDRSVADRISRFTRNNRALRAAANARCNDWSELPR